MLARISIFILFIQSSNYLSTARLVEVSPLKCRGKFAPYVDNILFPAAFLSRGKLEIIESSEDEDPNKVILCDLMPIPLLDGRGQALVTQLQCQTEQKSVQFGFDSKSVSNLFVNFDKGLYDNLPYGWRKDINAKLELFNVIQKSPGTDNIFIDTMTALLDAHIAGLLIEVKDELSSNSVSIGAAIVLCRKSAADEWKVSSTNPQLPLVSNIDDVEEINQCTACIVNCHLDELIAVSLLTGKNILIPQSLFAASAIDAKLTNASDDSELSIYGPVFRSAKKRLEWKERSREGISSTQNSGSMGEVTLALPAWEIFDAKRFLQMSSVEKRATLRASGVTSLPRPREGLDSLDRALVDQMDEAVRGEFLRLLQISSPNTKSPRQGVLQAMGEALDDGDLKKAEALRDQFIMMTAIRADPTQKEGSYDRYLDQDDWYMAARRKAMAPKK